MSVFAPYTEWTVDGKNVLLSMMYEGTPEGAELGVGASISNRGLTPEVKAAYEHAIALQVAAMQAEGTA